MQYELFEEIKAMAEAPGKYKKNDMHTLINKIRGEYAPVFEDNQGKCKMVSLDTSSKISGYAYFESGELRNYGKVDCSKEKDAVIRVENMILGVFDILNEYSPDIVVIETNIVGRNAKTERMLGHIVGSINGWALANYKEFVKISPSEWRKAVKGEITCPREREPAKQWSIARVNELYGRPVSDDEADAILVGTALINIRN